MMRPNTPDWTEAEKATIRKQWAEGFTARQIGLGLGRSRSAVCGMARRLKLKARQVQDHTGKTKAQQHATNGHRTHRGMGLLGPPVPVAPSYGYARGPVWEPLPGHAPVSMMELEANMCRWPMGQEKPFLFCGAPTNGSSYCDHHADVSAGDGSSLERAALKLANDANNEEWKQGEAAKMRKWEHQLMNA